MYISWIAWLSGVSSELGVDDYYDVEFIPKPDGFYMKCTNAYSDGEVGVGGGDDHGWCTQTATLLPIKRRCSLYTAKMSGLYWYTV